MRCCLAMLVVLVSAQEKDKKFELSFDSCPVERGCPKDNCCTDYACDKQDIAGRRRIKCCSKEQLIAEQQLSSENRICSPCIKCSKY